MSLQDIKQCSLKRRERLRAFIALHEGQPVIWGVSDCSAWVARWVRLEAGISLSMPLYANEREAKRLSATGLVSLWRAAACRAGVLETGAPELGDVGLIESRHGPIGCIFLNAGFVVVRSESGTISLKPRDFIRAWEIPSKKEAHY